MARTPISLPFDPQKLRELRERRGYLQGELARRCRENGTPVSRSQISNIERGRYRPTPPVLVALAKALDIEVDDFLTAEPDQEAS